MIPKIIHYTWFSQEPFPVEVQECIASWHKFMPDWEYRLWDAESIRSIDNVWLKECLAEKKWAFASDFVRLYAVSRYGGIYLDTDCKVFHSLEPMLQHSAFIGQEWYAHIDCFTTERYLTSHCFGAEANHPFLLRCLHYYDDRHFVRSWQSDLPASLRFDQTLLPKIQSDLATLLYGYDPSPKKNSSQSLISKDGQSRLQVYPNSYFDCYTFRDHTCVQHLALGGWSDLHAVKPTKITLGYRIRYHLDMYLHRLMWRMGYILVDKK